MMLPNKYGTMVRAPREIRKPFYFKRKGNELMGNYIDVGMGNYVVFDSEQIRTQEQTKEKDYFQGY